MSLTDTPPNNWNDDHRVMFENNMRMISSKFKRLSGMHFSTMFGNFSKHVFLVTITHADGSEYYDVVSSTPEQKKKIQTPITLLKKEMKKNKMSKNYTMAIIALCASFYTQNVHKQA